MSILIPERNQSLHAFPKVVISGGGPAGLAAALELIRLGGQVTLLEKREENAPGRNQIVALDDDVLGLTLEKNGIYTDLYKKKLIHPVGNGNYFVRIKDLEQAMKRALRVGQNCGAIQVMYNTSITEIKMTSKKLELVLNNEPIAKPLLRRGFVI